MTAGPNRRRTDLLVRSEISITMLPSGAETDREVRSPILTESKALLVPLIVASWSRGPVVP